MDSPNESIEFVGKFALSFIAIALFIMLGYNQIGGIGLQIYDSSTQEYTASFPPWAVNGTLSNGTEVNADNELTVIASTGTYAYTTDVLDQNDLIEISDIRYNADLDPNQGQEIELKVYTSEDGFATIENVQTFSLEDGVGNRVVDLPRAQDYRVQVLLTYTGTGQEPTLNSLTLDGKSYNIERDYSIFLILPIMALLGFLGLYAVASTLD